eukprot:TRINITY_DN19251_c0_g1_i1.p1 TRINITY_DN19251_c0_g1~~TRINITY_DN19251_c0_g1_i1.p1  ORF type:complete len:173 (-),score=22.19 TRINITY_DN19251_c0_g1_i1:18-536(-)
MREYNVHLVGLSGVGKSAICTRFVDHSFSEEPELIEDIYRRPLDVAGEDAILNVWDVGKATRRCCIIIVYSIDNEASFEEARRLGLDVYQNYSKLLVATKSDLRTTSNDALVTPDQGAELAKTLNCDFMECSAKSDIHIEEIFRACTTGFRTRYPKQEMVPIKRRHVGCEIL